ncbi:MAG: class II aldolase [Candidatus Puniceispirillum sp.]|nr:class II aldolase [Candidatus Puniceispirillum sp.]
MSTPCDKLAQAYHLAAALKLDDTIFTHISVKEGEQFFLPPFGVLFEEVTPSCLEGLSLDADHGSTNLAGAILHGAVYKARPDVGAVVHFHSPFALAVSCLKGGLAFISQFSMLFYGRIGYHAFEGISLDRDEQSRLGESLGNHKALLLHNHGLLTVAPTLPEAFMLAYYLERSCEVQLLARQGGEELIEPSRDVCEHTAAQFEGPERASLTKAYDALLRRARRQGFLEFEQIKPSQTLLAG